MLLNSLWSTHQLRYSLSTIFIHAGVQGHCESSPHRGGAFICVVLSQVLIRTLQQRSRGHQSQRPLPPPTPLRRAAPHFLHKHSRATDVKGLFTYNSYLQRRNIDLEFLIRSINNACKEVIG